MASGKKVKTSSYQERDSATDAEDIIEKGP